MDIANPEYWEAVVRRGNSDAALNSKAKHLEALTVALEIGKTTRTLEFHRGQVNLLAAVPLRGTSFRIAGPAEEWRRLVSGEIPYAQAINVVHGQLRLQGDVIASVWATPAIWELFRAAVSVYKEDVSHG